MIACNDLEGSDSLHKLMYRFLKTSFCFHRSNHLQHVYTKQYHSNCSQNYVHYAFRSFFLLTIYAANERGDGLSVKLLGIALLVSFFLHKTRNLTDYPEIVQDFSRYYCGRSWNWRWLCQPQLRKNIHLKVLDAVLSQHLFIGCRTRRLRISGSEVESAQEKNRGC